MKIRNGFVSNSSSSSFIILLPDNFDVDKHIEENWEEFDSYTIGGILDEYDDEIEEGMDEIVFAKDKLKEIINNFIDEGYVYQEDYTFNIIEKCLDYYCIANIDVSSDSGTGSLADKEQIKKILGI